MTLLQSKKMRQETLLVNKAEGEKHEETHKERNRTRRTK